MRLLAATVAAISLAVPPAPSDFVSGRQQPGGGYAEIGGAPTLGLTAWSVLGLAAAGRKPGDPSAAAAFLVAQATPVATDLELKTMALAALDVPVAELADRIEALRRADGRIGALVNSTAWGVLALRTAGRGVDPQTVRWLVARQASSGGWPWAPGGAADTDDTAVVIEALLAGRVPASNRAVRRGLTYLARAQRSDGGYGQTPGAPSNAQTTAWVVQALTATGRDPVRGLAFLARLQFHDGSLRYSIRYRTTPLWVTAQVLPALFRRPFPLT